MRLHPTPTLPNHSATPHPSAFASLRTASPAKATKTFAPRNSFSTAQTTENNTNTGNQKRTQIGFVFHSNPSRSTLAGIHHHSTEPTRKSARKDDFSNAPRLYPTLTSPKSRRSPSLARACLYRSSMFALPPQIVDNNLIPSERNPRCRAR